MKHIEDDTIGAAPVDGRQKIGRRSLLTMAAALLPGAALAPSVLARDYGPGSQPVRYPEPDVIVLDKRFAGIKVGNAAIERLWTGARWMEGTAWCGSGNYLVWSDIPNNRQMRWLNEDGHVSKLR